MNELVELVNGNYLKGILNVPGHNVKCVKHFLEKAVTCPKPCSESALGLDPTFFLDQTSIAGQ